MGMDIDISRSSSTEAVLGWGPGIIKLKAIDLWSHPGLLSGCLLRPFTVTFKETRVAKLLVVVFLCFPTVNLIKETGCFGRRNAGLRGRTKAWVPCAWCTHVFDYSGDHSEIDFLGMNVYYALICGIIVLTLDRLLFVFSHN